MQKPYFNKLWHSEDAAVLVTKKPLQDFAFEHERYDGHVKIVVNGKYRRVKWENVGAGLYRVYTTEDK